MEPFDPPSSGHPVVALLGRVEDVLDQAVASPVFALNTGATAEVLQRLTVLESKVAAVKLAALAHAGVVDPAVQEALAASGIRVANVPVVELVETAQPAAGSRFGRASAEAAGISTSSMTEGPADPG